ncbi:MAG: SGNH/GDSL hydrolase family protein [Bacteroidota bacterium]|nr:SGNH/GDSL hydrolase family protein [Bacteroidota bacterium]
MPYYIIDKKKDNILTIGLIGDSWVTKRKLDSILHEELLRRGYFSKILSSGQSGAKSKSVYYNLFKDNNKEYSSKFIIENNPDYCIVIAGINDAVGQMGSHYYSHHLRKIIKTLLNYNIKPVIVSLPNVGVTEILKEMKLLKKYRNILSAFINNKGVIDNIESYRKKLNQKLKLENLNDQIILIDFDNACESYSNSSSLYYNPLHLTPEGNEKLAHYIADELIKELEKN